MKDYAFYNGIITPYDACTIPLSDRSIFFGDSVYDVVLGHKGVPYQLEDHLKRLLTNAERIGLGNIPCNTEIREAIDLVLKESAADDFVLYIQLSGYGKRREHQRGSEKANLLITVTESVIPDKLYFVDAVTEVDIRHGYCDVKTTNLLPAVLSTGTAIKEGGEVTIYVRDGVVSECSSANVSFIKNNVLVTHPLDSNILPGISEKNLVRVCKTLGIGHDVRYFSERELFSADAVFVTSTTKLLRLCRRIDGIALPTVGCSVANTLFSDLRREIM